MEDLLHLELIEELENAEIAVEAENNINIRDPVTELNEDQFQRLFRVTKDLFRFIVEIVQPYMRAKVKKTDLEVSEKVSTNINCHVWSFFSIFIFITSNQKLTYAFYLLHSC